MREKITNIAWRVTTDGGTPIDDGIVTCCNTMHRPCPDNNQVYLQERDDTVCPIICRDCRRRGRLDNGINLGRTIPRANLLCRLQ